MHVCASTLSPFQENFRGQSKRAIACTDCAATTSESSTPSAFVRHKVHLRRRKPPTRCTLDWGQKSACKNPQSPETARTAGRCERDGVGRPTTSLYLAILSNGSVNIKNVGGRVVKTREWQFNAIFRIELWRHFHLCPTKSFVQGKCPQIAHAGFYRLRRAYTRLRSHPPVRHSQRRPSAVTGHHHDFGNTQLVQGLNHGFDFAPQGIVDTDDRSEITANAQKQIGIFRRQSREFFLLCLRDLALLILEHKVRLPIRTVYSSTRLEIP